MKKITLFMLLQLCIFSSIISQDIQLSKLYKEKFKEIVSVPSETGLVSTASIIRIDREGFHANQNEAIKQNMTIFDIFYNGCLSAKTAGNQWLKSPEKAYKNRHKLLNQTEDRVAATLLAVEYDRISLNKEQVSMKLSSNRSADLRSSFVKERSYVSTMSRHKVSQKYFNFEITKEDLIGNVAIDLSSIKMDFGDQKGIVPITIDQSINVQYKSWGAKSITLSYDDEDGNHIEHAFRITLIERPEKRSALLQGGDLGLNCDNSSTDQCMEFGEANKILASFEIACGDEFEDIRRPIIFLDGIDLFWDDNRVDASTFLHNNKGNNLATMFDAPITGEPVSMYNYLEANGYDLIFVDYFDHHTKIQNNAAAVQELLIFLNDILKNNGSQYETTLVGFSMGGLIGKYSLLDLEARQIDHGVGKYIAFDAPLQGANIPLAIQGLVRHAAEVVRAVPELYTDAEEDNILGILLGVDKVLDSHSPQQLLTQIYRPNNPNTSSPQNEAFFEELSAFGELQQCQYFTVSNGSKKGFPQGRQLDSDPNGGPNNNLLFYMDVEEAALDNLPTPLSFFLTYFAYLIDFEISTEGRYQDGTADVTVYQGVFDVGYLETDITHNPLTIAQSSIIDIAPGGSFPISALIPSGIPIATLNQVEGFYLKPFPNFCFIPTSSALDMEGADLDMIIGNYVDTPAESWVAQEANFIDEEDGIPYENNVHIGLIPDNIYFMTEILVGAKGDFDEPEDDLTTIYNFGRTNKITVTAPHIPAFPSDVISTNLTVNSGGELRLNNNGTVGFPSGTIVNTIDSDFTVVVGTVDCENTSLELTIADEGLLVVGDHQVDNRAKLLMGGGSELILEDGSATTIDQNSALEIGEMATLTIQGGAILNLEENSNLKIKGTLKIEGDVNIQFLGNIEFYPGAQVFVNGNLQIMGDGTDAVLSIKEDANIMINQLQSLTNSELKFEKNASLQLVESPSIQLSEVVVSSPPPSFTDSQIQTTMLTITDITSVNMDQVTCEQLQNRSAIQISGGKDCHISNSTFIALKRGVNIFEFQYVTINNTTFAHETSYQQSLILGRINTVEIDRSRFGSSPSSWYGNTDIRVFDVNDLAITSSQFSYGDTGIAYQSNANSNQTPMVYLGSTSMSAYRRAAVNMESSTKLAKLELECNRFSDNRYCIQGRNIDLLLDYPMANGIGTNTFSRSVNGWETYNPIFKVHYTQSISQKILMRGNNWGFNGPIESDIDITSGTPSNDVLVQLVPYVNYNSVYCMGSPHDGPRNLDSPNDMLQIFPNPTRESFEITNKDFSTYNIYDINGSLITNGSSKKVDVSKFNNGVYYITLLDSQEQPITSSKFIKF